METKTSCIAREPLSKLDEHGSASVLNYNLPQAVSYEVVSLIELDVPQAKFKPKELERPKNSYWSQLEAERKADKLNVDSITRVVNGKAYSPIPELQDLALNLNSTSPATKSGLVVKAANVPISTKSVGFSTDHIANKINDGYMPVLYKRVSGKQGLKFAKEPEEVRPALYLVMRMRMASYLGDYGAGQTLSTFSLLPGEKTTISIRNYQHNEETRASSQSVLDSYSESCTDDLQTTVEESTSQSESSTETDTDTMSAEAGVSGGVNLGVVKLGGDSKGSASSVNTMSEAVGSQVDTLTSAVNHHVQTADTQRQVEINTETTSSSITETEVTTARTLENTNRSRVLNFVFRQLLQEYYTVTYLHDVSFVYSNGFKESRKTASLSSLGSLLRRVLADQETVKEVKNTIFEHLCNIPDYQGNRTSFIEKVEEQSGNCIDPSAPPSKGSVVRKKKGLTQTYRDKSFDGIIVDVTHRIVRTPSVMVDALLGQGEALDCYNMQLQEAAYTSAHLANKKVEQGLAIVDAITDPVAKAVAYRRVFGECCDDKDTTETPGT
ncbi:MAG: hypothetical protein ABL971_05335 [Vicinamibacterales bacterium]